MEQWKIARSKELIFKWYKYKILVNGKVQCMLSNGQESVLTVNSGASIQAKLGWVGSKPVILPKERGIIKEINVKVNKGPFLFPVFSALSVILIGLVNLSYPGSKALMYMASIIDVFPIIVICLLTIWRNTFLDIQIVAAQTDER
jgi:hypothetical protein